MRKLLTTFALVLWAAVAGAQDHTPLVKEIQDALTAKGVAIRTVDGAFEVTKRVAWALRTEGCSLLLKPGGENIVSWQGRSFSAGRVCFAGGHLFKILSDIPSTNGPQWLDNGTIDPASCVPAMDPDDPVTPPVVTPPPPSAPPPVVDWPAVLAQLKALAENQASLAENVKQTVRNEVQAARAADASEHQAIRDDVQSVWKNIGLGVLDLLKQPWVWTALGGILAGLKMKGL